MSVELTPDLQQFIDEQVRLGNFPSAQAVVREALLRMKEQPAQEEELDEELLASIEEGEKQIQAGTGMDWDETIARLRSRYTS